MEVKDFYQYVMILIIKTLTILFLVQNSLKMSLKIRSGQKSIDLDLALFWQIFLVQNSLKMSLNIRSGQKSIDLDLALFWQIILDL